MADTKHSALRIAGTTAFLAKKWTARRDKAILIAHAEGASLREIAKATGLSHVGVKKLLDRSPHGDNKPADARKATGT